MGHVELKGVRALSPFQAESLATPPTPPRKPRLQLESLSPSLAPKTPVLPSSPHRSYGIGAPRPGPDAFWVPSHPVQGKGTPAEGLWVEDQRPPQALRARGSMLASRLLV